MHKLMLDGEAQDAYGDFLKEGFAQARLFWVADTAAKYAFKILIVDESRVCNITNRESYEEDTLSFLTKLENSIF
ncbi:hypothetical protein EYC84_010829 [Monilinia fructicola]|uniref:Uncharacterized protein n=1 Tax=Monilinia fructicola TaxID=38448 RepID=A0A5M9J948_MONFR|nr:hypothetical protein EYC84_010829 [Monilinia fructicola]